MSSTGGATPWWERFFDEDYVFLYSAALTPERSESEVAGAAALLRLKPGARVLDLCCGDGRHAIPLQRRGFAVTGVDSSAPLLRAALKRAEIVGARPLLVRADARALPLRAGFDAALLLFNSLGYGSDADSVDMLREARRCAPQLLLEVAHRDEHVRRAPPGVQREWMELRGAFILTERWIDPLAGVAHAVFRFNGRVKEFRHRIFTATELLALLREAGFAKIDAFGGYDRRPFATDSPQLVVHAR
jgi:SAM-dependent methyltransferase